MIEFGLNLLKMIEFSYKWTITKIPGFLPEILGFLVILFLMLMVRRIRKRHIRKDSDISQSSLETSQTIDTTGEASVVPEADEAVEAPGVETKIEETERPAPISMDTEESEAEALEAAAEPAPAHEIEKEKEVSFFKRLKNGLSKTRESFSRQIESVFTSGRGIDDEALEQIEEALITADVGVDTTMELMQRLSKSAQSVNDMASFKNVLKQEMRTLIDYGEPSASLSKPYIIMVVGVNGVGKTTTIGKLAAKYRSEGKKVILGAADTFRAAAVEQLEIWAERSDSDIIKHRDKADPAAVAYDTVQAALARDADIVIIDTAGRLHTKVNLMEQLKKITRTISRQILDAPHEVLLVVDATTGQNAVSQAKMFHQEMGVTGIALTKLDGTAKGGIVLGISHSLNIPIRYIGIGEKISDLQPFDPQLFIDALL